MEEVIALVERDFFAPLRPQVGAGPGRVHRRRLPATGRRPGGPVPSDAVAAVVRDADLWLIPLRGPRSGSAAQTAHPAGDRATLIREVLADRIPEGVREAFWDDANKALRIPLDRH